MSLLQRMGSIKDSLVAFMTGTPEPKQKESQSGSTGSLHRHSRSLQKHSSRGNRPSSAAVGLLEALTRDAIATYVQEKFDKGEAKPHVFTQFWLQFPKLETGFDVLRGQLEARTGSRDGPLPLVLLRTHTADFGLPENSAVVADLCDKAAAHKCRDIDFVGLVMLLLVVHLTEPAAASARMCEDVHTMLSCLELAFTHFNSARKGKLDKREVGEALQYESAKAHTKEGRSGRTSNRLAHRLFEGLDWEYDNTISFENFLRGILHLVSDEFGDEEDDTMGLGEGPDGTRRIGSTPGGSGAISGAVSPRYASASTVGAAASSPRGRSASHTGVQ